MMIGSSHGVNGGPITTEGMSVIVAQIEPIHAENMEQVNKNIDQLITYMEIGARGSRSGCCGAIYKPHCSQTSHAQDVCDRVCSHHDIVVYAIWRYWTH